MTASPPKLLSTSRFIILPKYSWAEFALVLALFLTSFTGGTIFWKLFLAWGYHPSFYQQYFEPAVMIACGKGFVVSGTQPVLLVEFLKTQRDSFNCADIPSQTVLGREGLYQGAWRYLLSTVGWFWKFRGVSWSGLGPLIGLFFAVTIVFMYATCRIGMGRLLALFMALGFASSAIHLMNLPHLRDYSKAPFTLALIFILGLLVVLPARRSTVFALAAAYGAVLGIGYGFRTDFLVNLPVFPLVLFAFLPGGFTRNLGQKAVATLIFFTAFFIASWPITSTVYAQGGCQWHVTLLGLQSPFDDALHITHAPYDFGYVYGDRYVQRAVSAFASGSPDAPPGIVYCSHEYDVQSWNLLKTLIIRFPADFMTRSLGAVSQIIDLPFEQSIVRPLQWAEFSARTLWTVEGLYRLRMRIVTSMQGDGKYLVAAALLILSATSLRLAFFLLFFILYFAGYPAIQFHPRHYFHLELITWWSFGFVADQMFHWLRSGSHSRIRELTARVVARRVVLFTLAVLAIILLPLITLRWYQQRQATSLFTAYIQTPREPILTGAVTEDGHYVVLQPTIERPTEFLTQFVEVDLNSNSCARTAAVTFRYDPAFPNEDFTRTVSIDHALASAGVTRIFIVLYERFRAVEFSGVQPGCILGVYRLVGLRSLPVLLDATLRPGWERLPLYQRLADWERK